MDEIQIANIAKELQKLHDVQKEKKEIRASLFTLIIYVHEDRRAHYINDIVQNIIEKYPCRIIFITADRNPDSSFFRVTVSSAVNSKGGALIACDQINIEAGQKQIHRVPFLILPHLLTDLPIYLIWGQDPAIEISILPALESLANRFIFDAECNKNLKKFTEVILERSQRLSIDLVDINWALGSNWRDMIIHAFILPEHLQELKESTKIHIIYNNDPSDWVHQPEMQAIYLQGWLATRFCWSFEGLKSDSSGREFAYSNSYTKKPVVIKISPQSSEHIPSGSLMSFETHSSKGYHFLLKRDELHLKATFNCTSESKCELPITLPLMDSKRGFTFMNEIFYSVQSPHYIEMLKLLNKMEW